MTLLSKIIDGASGDAPVSMLLRQLKVVAARTNARRLDEWVNYELDGYPSAGTLPSYRGPFNAIVLGHFSGVMGSEIKNAPIPAITMPENMRDSELFKINLLNPVAEIEDLSRQESVNLAWPADAVQYYNYGLQRGIVTPFLREDMGLMTASRPVTRAVFIGTLNGVRNRILDLALELEREAPEAGQPEVDAETANRAEKVVNTFNFYASSNVAVSSSNLEQNMQVAPGDTESLIRALRAAGVTEAQLQELKLAIAEDKTESGAQKPNRPGPKVLAWIARTSMQVGTGAAGGAIGDAITAFFG